MLRFVFTFLDRENTARCYLNLNGVGTIAQAVQVANEFESVVSPITDCLLGDVTLKLKVPGGIAGRPLATSNVYDYVIYLCKDNLVSGSFMIPSSPAGWFDAKGPYAGVRIFDRLPTVKPLVQAIFDMLPTQLRPDGVTFPQQLVVAGKTSMVP